MAAPVPFSETTRSVQGRSLVGTRLIAGAALVLSLWLAWSAWGRVGVYRVSQTARIERAGALPVHAPLSGVVVHSALRTGAAVRQGDRLIAIDAEAERLELERQRAARRTLEEQREAVTRQLEILKDTRASARAVTRLERSRAAIESERADLALEQSRADLDVVERLRAEGIGSEADLRLARTAFDQARALARARSVELERAGEAGRLSRRERDAEIEGLVSRLAGLDREMEVADARLRELGHAVERRWILAPRSGEVAELRELGPGAYVEAGSAVCTLVAGEERRVVASFGAEALGLLRPGQSARVRLHGFPATRFGTVPSRVRSVSRDVEPGRVRVELDVVDPATVPAPLEHGHPVTVEVEVERISPLQLLLRHAGRTEERIRRG